MAVCTHQGDSISNRLKLRGAVFEAGVAGNREDERVSISTRDVTLHVVRLRSSAGSLDHHKQMARSE